jgi:hypothetical protein
MKDVTRPSGGHWYGWLALLVHLQLTLGSMWHQDISAADEPRWPAQLIRAGTVLAAASGLLLGVWLRRRL